VLVVISAGVLALCILVLPNGIRVSEGWSGYRPLLIGMYIPAIPFFVGVFQTFKLLHYIDTNRAFSNSAIKALQYIKYCGIIIGGLYAVALPYIFMMADQDDAPGVLLIGLVFTFGPLALALLAGVMQKVFQNAIDLKSENELTI
jgi:hypothetical protein